MIKKYKEYCLINENKRYDSFSNLTKDDLYDIAKWSIYDGGYMLYDDMSDNDAISMIVSDFESLLNDNYPDGFKTHLMY